MTETKDVNKAELDWTLKMLEVLRNMKKRTTKLTIRHKDILAPLNLDENYKYCFKNKGIERELKKLNEHNFAKLQSIRRLTDTGGAISVVTMIKQLQERHDRQVQLHQQQLDQDAACRQRQEEERRNERLRSPAERESESEDSNVETAGEASEERTGEVTEELQGFFDHPPAPAAETVALVRNDSGMRRRLMVQDGSGAFYDLPISGAALITTSETPSKALQRRPQVETPPPKDGRRPNLSNWDKIQIAQHWIDNAAHPFETEKQSKMLVDCKRIVTRLSIERKGEQVNLKGDVWKATGGEKGDQTMAVMMADVLLGRAAAGPPKGGLKDWQNNKWEGWSSHLDPSGNDKSLRTQVRGWLDQQQP